MSNAGGRVLSKMLDRLLAGLMSGPNMNCRPSKSRQRIDLSQLIRLADVPPEELLRGVLGTERSAKAVARVKMPRRLSRSPVSTEEFPEQTKEPPAPEPKSPGEKAWIEQSALVTKLRVIADDARTYENDTGVHALSIGFPLLSLPPGSFGGGARPGTKRILAPIAFVAVTLTMKGGATPSAEIACHSDGADRVRANPALLSWIEQQTGKPVGGKLFEDEAGTDPWREIMELVEHVAAAVGVEVPEVFKESSLKGRSEAARAEQSDTATLKLEDEPPISDTVLPAVNELVEEPAAEPPGSVPRALEVPKTLALQPAPRGDEEDEQPAILVSAVLGLFPTAHQGLVRDTRAMLAESSAGTAFAGPIQSFLTTGIDFDMVARHDVLAPSASTNYQIRSLASERLAAAADPCQAKAVALARESSALVVHGPPGTGKSQTITNIIADHLSRGQRVLLVCEKRTALDVVADRLEHMGLRNFCGIVHDPQRDQRDLYRSIRQQLDDLPQAKKHPRAEASLAKVDAESQELHDELTGFHRSLMEPTAAGGSSFHDLMGQWMSAVPEATVPLDDVVTAGIGVEEFESHRAALIDLFRRARSVDFSKNRWADCAGVTLAEYLARPMTDVRTRMDRLAGAAEKADATADENMPPFNDKVGVADQAVARAKLADHLEELLPTAREIGLTDLNGKTAAVLRETLGESKKREAMAATLKSSPLEPDFLVAPLPALSVIQQQLHELQMYQIAMSGWTGFFHFPEKSAATKVLAGYGLPLSTANAERVQRHLGGLRLRHVLATQRELFLGTPSPEGLGSLPADQVLQSFFATVSAWFDSVLMIWETPALDGLIEIATKQLATEDGTALFLEGLRKSAARAEAIVRLEEEFSGCALFDMDWLTKFAVELRRGKLAEETTSVLRNQLDSLEGVLRVRAGRAAMPEKLQPVVDLMLSRVVEADSAMAAIQASVLSNEIRSRLRNDPHLQSIDAHRVGSAFERFRELAARKKLLVRDFIAHQWISKQQSRLLAATGTRLNSLGAALRQRLLMRGEHAIRLRQVIARGENIEDGDPLFDLCPVWMASPETVAQVFPRKAMFDVIVFDEASQCRLEEALPVLTRGRRVVIAGDPNQLPPTRFFESGLVQSDEEEPETEQEMFESQQGEIEDLLAAALNLAIQQCYLDVHYRSRNADLIEFSNRHFYASRLQAIPAHPANRSKFSPLTLYRVDGIYSKRRNEAEADRVVAIVKDLLKRATPPSIGIACLNLPQRDLIVEKLDDLAAEDADFAKRLAAARTRKGEGSFEGLFVKNLENVQGDERDDIIISTTYGPDGNGKFYRRFGPVGMAGGGRRLNVLVTRARNEVHLVTSIPVEAYRNLPAVPEGQSATGAWLLFAYLKYAEGLAAVYAKSDREPHPVEESESASPSTEPVPPPLAAVNVLPSRSPSLFSQQMANSLASGHRLGSDVHWGNDGFCVDLAVHDPVNAEEVTIGVLCDGCRYAAADDPVEWDIFRTGILENQGWTLRRVWTPHYFRDPEGNLQGVEADVVEFRAGVKS